MSVIQASTLETVPLKRIVIVFLCLKNGREILDIRYVTGTDIDWLTTWNLLAGNIEFKEKYTGIIFSTSLRIYV